MEKEKYLELIESLGSAGSDILKRYGEQRELIDRNYQTQLESAEKARDLERREAAAASRIAQLNTDAALSAQGLGLSGESVQARLMNDMTRNSAMENAAKRYDENVRRISEGKRQDDLNAQSDLNRELTDLAKELYQIDYRERRDQREDELADRKLEAENKKLEAENSLANKKFEAENSLAEKKLELERRKTDNDISLKNYLSQKALDDLKAGYESQISDLENALAELESGTSGASTYLPDNKPDEVYRSILNSANRQAGGGWGATADDKKYRELVLKALSGVLDDPYLDENFKRTIRFYARTDGFLE